MKHYTASAFLMLSFLLAPSEIQAGLFSIFNKKEVPKKEVPKTEIPKTEKKLKQIGTPVLKDNYLRQIEKFKSCQTLISDTIRTLQQEVDKTNPSILSEKTKTNIRDDFKTHCYGMLQFFKKPKDTEDYPEDFL